MKTKNSDLAKIVFTNMTKLLGLNARVDHSEQKKNILLAIQTEEPGRLIGRNGASLNSLDLLLGKIFSSYNKSFPKVILNVNDSNEKKVKKGKKEESIEKPNRTRPVDDVFNVYTEDGQEKKVLLKDTKEKEKEQSKKQENSLESICLSAYKELNRWGEEVLLPPLDVSKCDEAIQMFEKYSNIEAVIDEKKSFSDRKRIRISLKG